MKELKNTIINLIGSQEPTIIDKVYARGTEGNYILSFAPLGTQVQQGEDYYTYNKETIIIGWEQQPTYDNGGYMRYEWAITPETANETVEDVVKTWYEYLDKWEQ